MVTKSPTNQLLNKFSQLFSKPGAEDSDSEPASVSHSETMDRAAFERMQRHKRRDDSVRANELNQLRSIIQDGRGVQPMDAPERRASPRQPGEAVAQQRAILDKIDGAEAHLAQWWGTGSAPLSAQAPLPSDDDDDMELDFTGMLALSEDPPLQPDPVFESDSLTPPQAALSPLECCLRDAAMHYAEGAFEEARDLLRAMLAEPDLDQEAVEWLTFSLFDVYRCCGDKDRFEALALDYANRYGRSPAEWNAVSEQARSDMPSLAELETERSHQTFWRCPALLDQAALQDFAAHHAASSHVISINWLPLQQIDPAVAQALAMQLAAWSESQSELQWIGTEVLLDALQMCRLGTQPANSAPWWLMQLGLLCIMQQPAAFEELAMEYCVAFEMSPPSWKNASCKLVRADDVAPAQDFVATVPQAASDTSPQAQIPYATFELSGNLTGSNPPAVHALASAARLVMQIDVSCVGLGRVDLEAANALRNWLLACDARGCGVLLSHLPRLVLVYFQTLGLQELADISAGSF